MEDKTEVLGSHNLATDGPFKLEMSVMLIGTEGEHEGYDAWAGIDLPPGKIPTDAAVTKRLRLALDNVPKGFRLATREEFVRHLLIERTRANMNFAVPGPREFRLEADASSQDGGDE